MHRLQADGVHAMTTTFIYWLTVGARAKINIT